MQTISLADSVSSAITNIQRVINLMLDSAVSARGARYSLTQLIVMKLSPYGVSFKARTSSRAYIPDSADLHHQVIANYERAVSNLVACEFVPSNRIQDFAAAITSDVCLTATQLERLCGVSNDTASRWLNKAVTADLLRKIPVAKGFAYINVLHFALLQDLPIPLAAVPSATTLKSEDSGRVSFPNPAKYLDSYPAKYLESVTPPF